MHTTIKLFYIVDEYLKNMPSKSRSASKRTKRRRSKYEQIIVPFTVAFPNVSSQSNVNATSSPSAKSMPFTKYEPHTPPKSAPLTRGQSMNFSKTPRATSLQNLSSLTASEQARFVLNRPPLIPFERTGSAPLTRIQSMNFSTTPRARSLTSLSSLSPSERALFLQSISSTQSLPRLENVTSSSSTLDSIEDSVASRTRQSYKRLMPTTSPSRSLSSMIPPINTSRTIQNQRYSMPDISPPGKPSYGMIDKRL